MLRRALSAMLACLPVLGASTALPTAAADPGNLFNHELRRLHSDEVVKLKERYAGHPVLVINTASHCGFTKQFGELEAIHRAYKDRGLKVAGFPSDDFMQEAKDEAKTAEVCYGNYGVSFDMYSPIHVRGKNAHPLFKEIARQSTAPSWNFYKYVIDRDGRVVAHFSSLVKPDSEEFKRAIEKVL